MCKYSIKPADVASVMSKVNASVSPLTSKGVQCMFLCNGVSVTVEFSAYKKVLKTFSMIIFPNDIEKKVEFLNAVIERLLKEDPFTVVEESIEKYNNEFAF